MSVERLKKYLATYGWDLNYSVLRADASTREYYRIGHTNGTTAIACVYPEPFTAAEQSYHDVTALFMAADLPVASLYHHDEGLGVIVQEDLGDRILRDEIIKGRRDRDRSIDEAITLIAKIQAATPQAFKLNSIASRLRFDAEKLSWELEYFKTHYFTTFANRPLSPSADEHLSAEFDELSRELESHAAVLCHRDFHAANLMVDAIDELRIIDHQDARIGSVAYDLVSLLLDRVTEIPSDSWLSEKRRLLSNEREKFGLAHLDEPKFEQEFYLQTIQRCLKAAGTFSYQAAERGKSHFIPFIEPMFRISIRAAEALNRFPATRDILSRELRREDDPHATA